jgi:hypothetical protein
MKKKKKEKRQLIAEPFYLILEEGWYNNPFRELIKTIENQ